MEKKERKSEASNVQSLSFAYSKNLLLLSGTLVKMIAYSAAEYCRRARFDSALADYSDGTRLARTAHTRTHTSKHRLSILRVRLIALNQISSADASGRVCTYTVAYARTRVPVVKDFIVMNLIFIQTVPAVLFLFHSPLSLFVSLSLPLPLPSFPLSPVLLAFSLSLSPSFILSSLSWQHSTNRALRTNADVVCRVLREEQGWRALQRSAISRLVIRNPIKPGDTGEI